MQDMLNQEDQGEVGLDKSTKTPILLEHTTPYPGAGMSQSSKVWSLVFATSQ